eukprot:gene29835-biopygen11557
MAAPLSDLTKLKGDFGAKWTAAHSSAFEGLKTALTSAPALMLPDFDKPFEVISDASLLDTGAVLLQDKHPVAYSSKKYIPAEKNYTVSEQEMLGDHDLSLHLMVYSLSVTKCKPRVRSKKPITGAPLPIKSIMDRILEGYAFDPLFDAGHKRLRDKFSRDRFWFKKSKHGRYYLCVPDNRVLKQDIIREQHDPIYMGHCGRTKTLELVTRTFTWDGVTGDVKDFIKRCPSCQTNTPGNLKPGGTLVPVEIPLQFWDCVSTDLITALPPTTSGHDAIAVFVDKLSKMVRVAPCSTTVLAVGFAAIYLDTVVRHHGIPKKLLSDRDAWFTGHFGSELQRLMGTRQAFSTAFHPQTDGQTERMNRVIEDMIRHHVGPYHDDWDQSLALVDFAINNSWQESIQNTPFRAYLGYDPRTPMAAEVDSKCPAAKSWWASHIDRQNHCRDCLKAAQSRQKANYDTRRREVTFSVSGVVGPRDEVTQDVRQVTACRLDLPKMMKLHPVFHVDLLKPWHSAVNRTSVSPWKEGLATP